MPTIDFPATKTQKAFIISKAYINFILGPRGEGKTTSGLMAVLSHAMEQNPVHWPIRWAVIRDTWENLRITTIDSIRRAVKQYGIPNEGLDKLEPRIVKLGMRTTVGSFRPLAELNFFGLDQPEDANRLQGFEGAGAWIEEPAPAADVSSGIPEDCMLVVTSLRQGGTEGVTPRVQITMNPPDKDHWTMKYRDDEDVVDALRRRGMTVAFFEIPPGENPGVTAQYREANRAILEAMGRHDLIARLVEGQVGYVQMGVAVTPEFGQVHIAKSSLPILRTAPVIRSYDFGLNPTTTFWQVTPIGRINVFYSVRSEHMGMEQHILQQVLPWLGRKGIRDYHFEDDGDPNGLTPEARNSNLSAVSAIEEMLTSRPGQAASFTPGPISIQDRVGPIRFKLRSTLKGGHPIVQVDPEAPAMIRTLGGAWHRKKTPAGLVGDPVKDWACVDMKTEMLTCRGWKTATDLSVGEAVYSYDMSRHVLAIDALKAVQVFDGRQAALRIHGKPLDMVVTLNHRVVVVRRRTRHGGWHSPEVVRAEDLHTNHHLLRVSQLSLHRRTAIYTDEFVRICAWVAAEGHFRKSNGGIHLYQSLSHNPQYVEELDHLLRSFPGTTRQKTDARGGVTWLITRELAFLIRQSMPDKVPSPEFINAMRPNQRRLFLYEYVRADGTWEHAEYGAIPAPPSRGFPHPSSVFIRPGTPQICEGSSARADALQWIAAISGIRASVHWGGKWKWGSPRTWHISLAKQGTRTSLMKLSKDVIEVPGVWCPTTENGTWIARRNGHVFITGNSEHGDSWGYGMGIRFPIPDLIERPKPKSHGRDLVGLTHDRSWMTS